MALFKIAGLTVEILAGGRTIRQAQPYATDEAGPVDISVTCDPPEVLARNPECRTEDHAEYMETGTLFAKRLLKFGGFQLHSSAVLLDGKAYLFSAPSGTGKSTHTEKWCRLFGGKLLNDDKPALRKVDDTWMAYGTPWSGKHDLSVPLGVPLGAIAYLRRGQENRIRRLTPQEALPCLLSQSLRYLNADQMTLQLMLLDDLMKQIPVWELVCRDDDEAAYLSYENMR